MEQGMLETRDVEDRPTLRRRLTTASLVVLGASLIFWVAASSQADPGGASTGWRIAAGAAWVVVIVGYSLLASIVQSLPEFRVADPRTRVQFVGAVAWMAASWFLMFVAIGMRVSEVAIWAVPFAIVFVAFQAFVSACARRVADESGRTRALFAVGD